MPCHQARLISPLMIVLPRGVNFCQLRPTFVTVVTERGLKRQKCASRTGIRHLSTLWEIDSAYWQSRLTVGVPVTTTSTTPTIRSVDRALDLLTAVCDHPGITLSEAARSAGLAPSSALRLLRTLTESGYLSRTPDGLYDVGPELIRVSGRVLADNSLRRLCRPTMTQLAAETGESVYLSVRHHDRAIYLALVPGIRAIQHRSWEGQSISLETSAAGAVLTGRIGQARYAVITSGVEKDVAGIAAPITLHDEVIAALSMVIPSCHLNHELTTRYGTMVASCAASLSKLIGDNPPHRRRRQRTHRPSARAEATQSAAEHASPTNGHPKSLAPSL